MFPTTENCPPGHTCFAPLAREDLAIYLANTRKLASLRVKEAQKKGAQTQGPPASPNSTDPANTTVSNVSLPDMSTPATSNPDSHTPVRDPLDVGTGPSAFKTHHGPVRVSTTFTPLILESTSTRPHSASVMDFPGPEPTLLPPPGWPMSIGTGPMEAFAAPAYPPQDCHNQERSKIEDCLLIEAITALTPRNLIIPSPTPNSHGNNPSTRQLYQRSFSDGFCAYPGINRLMCGKPDAFAVFFAIILFVAGVGIICRLSVARRNTSGDNIEMATTRRSRSLAVLDSRQVERVPRAHLGRRREVVATPHYEMPASRNSWLPFRKVLVVGGAGRGEEEENTGVEVAPPAYSAIQGN